MTLDVHLFPCRSDNYGFLIRDAATGVVAAVDTPDADRILHALQGLGWGRLDLILNTHWHPDHTEGNARLKAETGCEIVGPEEVARVAPLDRAVGDGDIVQVGETQFQVTATPGHTLGHIAYHQAEEGWLFSGDTLFAAGCGRLFEGSAAVMWASLSQLSALPDDTLVCCGHEYTEANGRFALSVDPFNVALRERVAAVAALRAAGQPTVPSRLGDEKAANPFLRADDGGLAATLGFAGQPAAEVFAEIRRRKDVF